MKYGWQIDEIEKKLSEEEKNDILVSQYKKEVYAKMLEDCLPLVEEDYSKISLNRFIHAVNNFEFNVKINANISTALYLGSLFSDKKIELPEVDLPIYPLEQVVDHAKAFVRRNDKNSYYFTRRLLDNKSRIQMTQICPFSSFLGKSYILQKNDYYILINSVNGVQDTVTLLHEASHIENNISMNDENSLSLIELGPLTREHYAFDFMENYEDPKEVTNARVTSLYHYLEKAIRLYETITLIEDINKDNNFETFSKSNEFYSVYKFITSNIHTEVDYIASLIASLDIYLNCSSSEAQFIVTQYQKGEEPLSVKTVDRVAPYLIKTFNEKPYSNYQKKY